MKILYDFYVIYNGKRVHAGSLYDDFVFRKKVKIRDKLFYRNAFGLDKSYIDDAIGCGAKRIELTVADGDQIYEIDCVSFKKLAAVDKVGKFGIRYYCSLEHWGSRSGMPVVTQ